MIFSLLFILLVHSSEYGGSDPPFKTQNNIFEILEGELYLGGIGACREESVLKENNIRVVVSVGKVNELDWIRHYEKIEYHGYAVSDGKGLENDCIIEYFEQTFHIIEYAKHRKMPVLVHGVYGKSKSAAFVISYLVRHFGLTVEESFGFVKEKNPSVDIDLYFQELLESYRKKLEIREKDAKLGKSMISSNGFHINPSVLIIFMVVSVLAFLGILSVFVLKITKKND